MSAFSRVSVTGVRYSLPKRSPNPRIAKLPVGRRCCRPNDRCRQNERWRSARQRTADSRRRWTAPCQCGLSDPRERLLSAKISSSMTQSAVPRALRLRACPTPRSGLLRTPGWHLNPGRNWPLIGAGFKYNASRFKCNRRWRFNCDKSLKLQERVFRGLAAGRHHRSLMSREARHVFSGRR
jgi:hypothetical protein